MSIHLFGIRHHGPGCARSLLAALDELQPDVIALEGPPDAQAVLEQAAHVEMKPPVALLIYPPEHAQRAVYYPLAVFSPEWQTLRWAARQRVPVRLMDLPQSHRIAIDLDQEEQAAEAARQKSEHQSENEPPGEADGMPPDGQPSWRTDPIALFAEAAGYADHELWWEEQFERRRDAVDVFQAILEAMVVVREHLPETGERDLLREAHMRTTIRCVQKEGHERIAVVCGAWHAPVLTQAVLDAELAGCKAAEDAKRLKGLPRVKTEATWIPWTYSRLTFRSCYGAGVHSPGWYAHQWESREQAGTRWIASAARLLRDADLDASSAGVLEATRLADALAAMRDLRSAGLAELNEAILTVLCHGDASPMKLVRNRLEINDRLGEVPSDAALGPLATDLARLQKSLRLKPSAEQKLLDLDLRNANDLARSALLHRLNLLGIPWGERRAGNQGSSTFHEVWQIAWKPEFAVRVIEASVWGNTVVAAATAFVIQQARQATEVAGITELLNQSILAGLNDATDPLLDRLNNLAALASDVRQLMDALPPLARVARYSDVRNTRAEHLLPVYRGLFERVLVGLSAACSALNDEAADQMLQSIANVQQSLETLADDALLERWHERLERFLESNVHGLLRGWACRLLLEKGQLTEDEFYRLARLALSLVGDTAQAAAWATGLLRGSGLLLLHQDRLWQVFDEWTSHLTAEQFTELLPLLRRAFSNFSASERRQMGEKVKRISRGDGPALRPSADATSGEALNHERAGLVLPVLRTILGVDRP